MSGKIKLPNNKSLQLGKNWQLFFKPMCFHRVSLLTLVSEKQLKWEEDTGSFENL